MEMDFRSKAEKCAEKDGILKIPKRLFQLRGNITGKKIRAPYPGALDSFFSLPTPALSGSDCRGYILSFLHSFNVNV